MDMRMANLSMNMAAQSTMRDFGLGMIKKSMDQMEQQGQQLVAMMNNIQSPQIPAGSTFSVLV